jgi:hypothetical protein
MRLHGTISQKHIFDTSVLSALHISRNSATPCPKETSLTKQATLNAVLNIYPQGHGSKGKSSTARPPRPRTSCSYTWKHGNANTPSFTINLTTILSLLSLNSETTYTQHTAVLHALHFTDPSKTQTLRFLVAEGSNILGRPPKPKRKLHLHAD